MSIKWRERKGLNPEVLLKKLDRIKRVEGDKISFGGLDKLDAETAITSMLKFPEGVSSIEKAFLINRTIFECAKTTFTKDNFLLLINKEEVKRTSTSEQEYYLLTSISLAPTFVPPKLEVGDCKIEFLKGSFPKKFIQSRNDLLKEERGELDQKYCKVIVTTRARSPHDAGDACLEAINLLRYFLCMMLNHSLSYSIGLVKPKPINRVVLGKHHTIHVASGQKATESYWYEPNFSGIGLCGIKDASVVKKNLKSLLRNFEDLPFKKSLRKPLIRFVNALDHTDHHSALVMAWSSLESVIGNDGEINNDLTPRRCSFLFEDKDYHKQILEHIREYRNSHVHHGESTEDPSTICYQLQRYFKYLILFYLDNAKNFINKDEANSFLDLPRDLNYLKRKSKLLNRAIKFLSTKHISVN